MENIRLTLIFLHVVMTIFLIYTVHPQLPIDRSLVTPTKHVLAVLNYISDLFRISIYHSSCIIALWYSRRRRASLIYATGILLLGELLQIITVVIQHLVEEDHNSPGELAFDIINIFLFLASIIITFKLAEISKSQIDAMQLQLLPTTV